MSQGIERDLLFLLHDVARLIRVEADKRARIHGMTRAQWAILLRLESNPGLSQKEIADLLEVEPISVARLVDRLEGAGLVERRADAADRRIWRLHLRPAAMSMLERIREQRQELASFVIDGVTPAMRETMIEGLLRIKSNMLQPVAAPVLRAAAAEAVKESA